MIPQGRRVLLCTEPVDMRRGIDGLRKTVMERFGDEAGVALYVFTNRRRDRAKLLWSIPSGWCLLYERLDGRRMELPTTDVKRLALDKKALAKLLEGVSRRGVARSRREIARAAREKVR